jgi:type IV pilus assembly protein PilY1
MLGIKFLRYYFLASVLCIFLPILSAQAKSPPPGSGAADVPANILIMLDTSGSMDTDLPSGTSRNPVDVAFDSDGNIYIAREADIIEKYNSEGDYITDWGGTTSNKQNGKFNFIYAIAVDANDNIYVSDRDNGRVQKFDKDGNYLMKFTLSTSTVYGIELDNSGNLYAINGSGNVEKFNASGSRIQTWNNSGNARHIAIDNSGNFYITRNSNSRVEKYSANGVFISGFTLSWKPLGIDVADDGNLYVSRPTEHRVHKLTPAGVNLAQYGSSKSSAVGSYNSPRGVQIRSTDGIPYIADYGNHRIQGTNNSLIVNKGNVKTRLQAATSVIKKIVSDSNLTSGANFGLMKWNTNASMVVNVSDTGADQIYTVVDSFSASGNTLLDNAMNLAKSYFSGATSPRNANASCQQNILIVISDGFWVDTTASATAQYLYDTYGIKTFTIGFTTTGNENYIQLSQKGGTYPDSPLYAENESSLLDVLANYIRQIISTQLTFTVPTIIPGITNSDHILQSTFLFKKTHQWKGHLYKYSLGSDGNIGSMIWDAGDKLNQKTAENRKIWTSANGLTHDINNFIVGNLARLRPALEENTSSSYDDSQLQSLIQFFRGVDSYDEFSGNKDDDGDTIITGERWKLADIYHSKAVAVSKPSAYTSDEANVNSESYYRAINNYKGFKNSSNCGGLCSARSEVIYVGSNSGMLHAFDSTSGEEKWAFIPPFTLPYLRDVLTNQTGQTNSIYGVDGSPQVKDILINGEWKTVLLCGTRQGAMGYFMLDITNPDDPKHLFSFAYNKVTGKVSYWNDLNIRKDYALNALVQDYDYSKIGESWSDPLILNIKINGVRKWVGVFGGGYNNNVSTGYGSAVYIIDLENGGKVLKRIDLPDYSSGNGIANSVPVRLTAITTDTTKKFTDAGALIYFTDLEGLLWKINLSDKGTLYDKEQLFNSESTQTNDRMCFNQVTSSILNDGRLAHYFGTSDMTRIGRVASTIQNRVYSFIDNDFPNYVANTTPATITSLQNVSSANAACPDTSQKGFYINMGSSEKITAAITINNSSIIIPKYTPSATNLCDSGTSKIAEYNYVCGSSLRETNLGTGMATEPIVYKNKLYIGISSDAALDSGTLPTGFVKEGNLIIGTPSVVSQPEVSIESWTSVE